MKYLNAEWIGVSVPGPFEFNKRRYEIRRDEDICSILTLQK